jgi:glycosyltransferase involved in cell wall biosynthesis
MTEPNATAVVVCSHFPFPVSSGGRKRTVRLLEAMERAGARPHIITHDEIVEGQPEARSRGWSYEIVPLPRGTVRTRLRQHVRSEASRRSDAIVQRLRALAPQIAFAQFEEVASIQYVHAAPLGLPTVVSLYNVDSQVARDAVRAGSNGGVAWRERYRAKRMELTERRAVRRADAVLAVSDYDRLRFQEWGARRSMLVANGVDARLFALPERVPSDERVLFFGHFGWAPNLAGAQRYLEETWPSVAAARPNAQLRIAGPRSDEKLREAAAAHERVEVLGFVDDLVTELAAARVVVAPLWVGGGTRIKVLEALAAARPVVGTPVGVERIGFEHDRHGLIADTPAGLSKATVRVLADDDAAARYAIAGRRLAEDYRWEATTAPAEELYRELLTRR